MGHAIKQEKGFWAHWRMNLWIYVHGILREFKNKRRQFIWIMRTGVMFILERIKVERKKLPLHNTFLFVLWAFLNHSEMPGTGHCQRQNITSLMSLLSPSFTYTHGLLHELLLLLNLAESIRFLSPKKKKKIPHRKLSLEQAGKGKTPLLTNAVFTCCCFSRKTQLHPRIIIKYAQHKLLLQQEQLSYHLDKLLFRKQRLER